MSNIDWFITQNIENLCKDGIWLRKKVGFNCGACVFTKNVNFLHYLPGEYWHHSMRIINTVKVKTAERFRWIVSHIAKYIHALPKLGREKKLPSNKQISFRCDFIRAMIGVVASNLHLTIYSDQKMHIWMCRKCWSSGHWIANWLLEIVLGLFAWIISLGCNDSPWLVPTSGWAQFPKNSSFRYVLASIWTVCAHALCTWCL